MRNSRKFLLKLASFLSIFAATPFASADLSWHRNAYASAFQPNNMNYNPNWNMPNWYMDQVFMAQQRAIAGRINAQMKRSEISNNSSSVQSGITLFYGNFDQNNVYDYISRSLNPKYVGNSGSLGWMINYGLLVTSYPKNERLRNEWKKIENENSKYRIIPWIDSLMSILDEYNSDMDGLRMQTVQNLKEVLKFAKSKLQGTLSENYLSQSQNITWNQTNSNFLNDNFNLQNVNQNLRTSMREHQVIKGFSYVKSTSNQIVQASERLARLANNLTSKDDFIKFIWKEVNPIYVGNFPSIGYAINNSLIINTGRVNYEKNIELKRKWNQIMNDDIFTSGWFDSVLNSLQGYQQESDGLTDQAKRVLVNALNLVKSKLRGFGVL